MRSFHKHREDISIDGVETRPALSELDREARDGKARRQESHGSHRGFWRRCRE